MKSQQIRLLITLVALSLVLAGCAGGTGGTAGTDTPAASSAGTVSLATDNGARAVDGETTDNSGRAMNGETTDRYIITLKKGHASEAVLAGHGLGSLHVYTHALHGFAAQVPAGRLNALKNDPRVERVELDGVVYASGKPSGGSTTPPPQTVPTGIRRIAAPTAFANLDLNTDGIIDTPVDFSGVGFGVAVIDTGVDLKHADLNVVNGATFVTRTTTANDDNGHGTHVAGTIGAKDNTVGVVGVAPGIRIYAVKVLNSRGSGYTSDVIKGVDWVTANASLVKVANMSLGGSTSDALDTAVRNSIAAGITYTIAGGNNHVDVSTSSPARVAEAITVSAITDADGLSGGDTFATYSNFGLGVDIAAPGTNIYSTYKGGTYATLSGTSMATPHVAGAAALLLAKNLLYTPADVRAQLTSVSNATFDYDATGDGDALQEPVLNVRNF